MRNEKGIQVEMSDLYNILVIVSYGNSPEDVSALVEGPVSYTHLDVYKRQVHMQDVKRPHRVTAIVDADAGEVFYHRQNPNEVVHIDIFHSEGRVSPKEVSLSIRGAFSGLRLETQAKAPGPNIGPFIPYIDLCLLYTSRCV